MWPFSGISMISSASISLVSLLLHGSPYPTSTGTGDQRIFLTHHQTNIGILSPGLSPVSLILSFYSFKSSLKLFQWALLTSVEKSFFPLWNSVSCVINNPMSYKMTHDQKKNQQNKALLVTPGLEPHIDCWLFLFLPSSSPPTGRVDKNTLWAIGLLVGTLQV